jgi:hypothetical protein
MTRLLRVTSLIGIAGALVLSAGGCADYTYFNLNVSMDNSIETATQNKIAACQVFIRYNGQKIEEEVDLIDLNGNPVCKAGPKQDGIVGTMNYSTAKKSGRFQFIVNMYETGMGGIILAQGAVEGDASPGKIWSLDLVASKCPLPCTEVSCNPKCPIDTKAH